MSILIKGMKMPKSCGSCFVGDRTICSNNCPLVEIPPHGRLIDADAFEKSECHSCDGACDIIECDCINCCSDCRCSFMRDIHEAPTVIEAEEDE